jgi:hypothetical protein
LALPEGLELPRRVLEPSGEMDGVRRPGGIESAMAQLQMPFMAQPQMSFAGTKL